MAREQYGLLIDFEWCTGCHACETAGRMANNLAFNQLCIKISTGRRTVGDRTVLDFIPNPTELCNLCRPLTRQGKLPSCVHHCPPRVIRYGERTELEKELRNRPSQILWTR